MARTAEAERFWAKVARGDECWLWQARRSRDGYGGFGRGRLAHRVSWEFANGPIPDGLCVLHKCDTPPCVNPTHLYLGTPADNARDRDSRGRNGAVTRPHSAPRGERNGKARLTDAAVLAFRQRYVAGERLTDLAREAGISLGSMHGVLNGTKWRHVPMAVWP